MYLSRFLPNLPDLVEKSRILDFIPPTLSETKSGNKKSLCHFVYNKALFIRQADIYASTHSGLHVRVGTLPSGVLGTGSISSPSSSSIAYARQSQLLVNTFGLLASVFPHLRSSTKPALPKKPVCSFFSMNVNYGVTSIKTSSISVSSLLELSFETNRTLKLFTRYEERLYVSWCHVSSSPLRCVQVKTVFQFVPLKSSTFRNSFLSIERSTYLKNFNVAL